MGITTIAYPRGSECLLWTTDRRPRQPVRNYDVSRLKPALRLLPIRILFAIEMTG